MESVMRHKMRTVLAFCGIVGTIAVAVSLAFVSGGRAASPNVCMHPTINGSAASCVTEFVTPHFISPPGTDGIPKDAISITKFVNESGASGATATHLAIKVSFPSTVTVKYIALSINGVAVPDTSGCTPSGTPSALPTSAPSVSCPAGNIAGGGTVKLTVRFSTSTGLTLTGSAEYGEGFGNPGNPPNDFQVNTDTLTVSGDRSAGGGCLFDQVQTATGTGTGLDGHTQTTSTTVPNDTSLGLPCIPVDAGVRTGPTSSSFKTQVSFVEFPLFSTAAGPATVKIFFTPLPSGVNINKFKLYEDSTYAGTFAFFITVLPCDASGMPQNPGQLDKNSTDSTPNHHNDSCIFNRASLPKGGGELDLHVIGSPLDGSYQG